MKIDNFLFRVTHEAALDAAFRYRVTACDARFLALANQLGSRLVTEDAKLRTAAPELTQSLNEALESVQLKFRNAQPAVARRHILLDHLWR